MKMKKNINIQTRKNYIFVIVLLPVLICVIFPVLSYAIEVRPCNNCALMRLVVPAQDPILSEPIDYDFSLFEKIYPMHAPKILNGLSHDNMFAIENAASFVHENQYSPDDVAAVYENSGRKNEIKYSDLEKMLMSLPQVKNDAALVKRMSLKEKYGYLVNIVKTNLLFEEGLALINAGALNVQSEEEYNRQNIFMSALNEAYLKISDEFNKKNPGAAPPDLKMAVVKKESERMELGLDTAGVLLLKTAGDLAACTIENTLLLCSFKGGKIVFGDIKKSMAPFFNGPSPYASYNDEDFINFMFYEIIFEHAYVKFLLNNNIKFEFMPYPEYRFYAISEGFLNDFIGKITIAPAECEQYFKNNQSEFTVKENIEVNYYVFGEPQKAFFEEASIKKYDAVKLSSEIKNKALKCEMFENEKIYSGQLMNETQKYLFSLKPGNYSSIMPIVSEPAGESEYIVFYVKSAAEEVPAQYKNIEKLIYRRALAEKKMAASLKLFDELFKKYNVKILINK